MDVEQADIVSALEKQWSERGDRCNRNNYNKIKPAIELDKELECQKVRLLFFLCGWSWILS